MPSMNNYQVMRHTLINLSQYTRIFVGSVLSLLAPCCLCWLRAVFVGSLSLLAPCCLCWLRAVFVGSVLSLLAPCCLCWLRAVFVGSLSFSQSFSSLSFFLPLFFSSCSSLLFCLYCLHKLQQSLCVCVCEGGRVIEIVYVCVCVCVCLQASCEKI